MARSSEVRDRLKQVKQISASRCAFAALREDGEVVSWGDPKFGGDSSEVQEQLRNVEQIHSTMAAFTAIRSDGSMVAWGNPKSGGALPPRLQHR